MALTQDELENRQAGFRTSVVALCVVVLLIVVYIATDWKPGGLLVDEKGVPLTDKVTGAYIAKSRSSSDVVAIIGAVTTFLGTLLGTYFGVNAGAQASKTVSAAAQTAIRAANDTSAIANQTATIAHQSNSAAQSAAIEAKTAQRDQTEKVRSLLDTMLQAQPHVDAAGIPDLSTDMAKSIATARSII